MLKTRKDFQQTMMQIMPMLASPETKITERKLKTKLLDLKRWYNPILEDHTAQGEALNAKYLDDKKFTLNRFGLYLSGDKDLYDSYEKELKEFLSEEIPECKIKFKTEEFGDSIIDFAIESLMLDAGLLD